MGAGQLTVPVGAFDSDCVPLVELDGVAEDGGRTRPHVELELYATLAHRHAHEVSVPVRQLSVIQQ